MEGRFCYNLGQAIVSHKANEALGEFSLATSTLHAVPFSGVTWEVEVSTCPDVTVVLWQIFDKDFSISSPLTVSFLFVH